MDSPGESYVTLNNYNFSLNEEFDYLDAFSEELKRAQQAQSGNDSAVLDENKNGSGSDKQPKP